MRFVRHPLATIDSSLDDDGLAPVPPPATVTGTSGNDFIHVSGDGLTAPPGYHDLPGATSGNDTITPNGGDDIVFAGDGNDRIVFTLDFTAADQIDGQNGTDTVELNGDYHAGVALAANTLANVEILQLDPGHSYKLDFTNASVPNLLKIDASALGASDQLNFTDNNTVADFFFDILGGAGNDTVKMSFIGVFSSVDLSQGGDDTVVATPNNGFKVYMGGALTAGDSLANVSVELNGDYSAGYSFGSATLRNISQITFDGGHSYDITLTNSATAQQSGFGIVADALGPGSSLIFDGSVLTGPMGVEGPFGGDADIRGGSGGGEFIFEPGGHVTFQGGLGADQIFFPDGFDPSLVHIDGGAGSDLIQFSENVDFTLSQSIISNVEDFILAGGTVVIPAGYLTSGATLTMDGTNAGALTVDGSAVTDATLVLIGGGDQNLLIGGSGDDNITMLLGTGSAQGGAGNDTFTVSLHTGQSIDGGAGIDTVRVMAFVSSIHVTAQMLSNVEVMQLLAGDVTFTFDDGVVAAGQTFTFDASGIVPGHPVTFDGRAETDAGYVVIGSPDSDTIYGGQGDDFIEGGAGNDTMFGNGGSDTVEYIHATGGVTVDLDVGGLQNVGGGMGTDIIQSFENIIGSNFNDVLTGSNELDNVLEGLGGNDTLNGGTGNDTAAYTHATGGVIVDLNISGGQNVGGGAGTDTLISIENLRGSEFADTLKGTSGDNVLEGQDGNDTLDLSLGGNDTALGGNGDDTILFGASLTAGDVVDGGAGNDTLVLAGDYSAGLTFTAAMMANVEILKLTGGHSYKLTLSDANVAGGQTLSVDASALGASDALVFDGSAETNGSFAVTGGAGNDTLTGGAGNDLFDLSHGGNDTVKGGAGNDTISFDGALTANDTVDGGTGSDTVVLAGDYSSGVVFSATTMVDVETLRLTAGHSYKLTLNDANVAAMQTLTVDASALAAANSLIFDGSAETNGSFDIVGGAGSDSLTGGAGNDQFDLSHGGNDTAKGGGGNDTFQLGGALTASDKIDGGAGSDTVVLDGDYSLGLTFAATTMVNVETLKLTGSHSYTLILSDGNVAAGQTLTVDASKLGGGFALTFDGSAEHDGAFVVKGGRGDDHIIGGDGADKLTGGKGNDVLQGGNGADLLNGARGNDVFVYTAVGQSTGPVFDTIAGFSTKQDKIDVWFAVTGVDAAVSHGALSLASFNGDLAMALGAAHLAGNHAVVFTPDAGDLAGDTFLVVDANGTAGYQAGQDLVIELDHAAHLSQLKVADFI